MRSSRARGTGTAKRRLARPATREFAKVPGARAAELPQRIPPQLAELAERAPPGDEWLHEIKFDGYRLGARLDRGRVTLLTRKGLDWTAKFPGVAAAVAKLPAGNAWLDGEACHVDEDGRTSFSGLQDDLSSGRTERICFFAFDLLHVDGCDLRAAALEERKAALAKLIKGAPAPLMLSEHVVGKGPAFLDRACQMKLEGIVSKRRDAPYRSGRSSLWLKSKCLNREEFVVVGWTPPEGSRIGFGSLVLGYYTPKGELLFAGRAGTGFSDRVLRSLSAKLKTLARTGTPLARLPPPTANRYGFGKPFRWTNVRWVNPKLVAEVTYLEWTADAILRHVVFEGLREDKPAREVVRHGPG